MENVIYWFSGTGHSLEVAKGFREELGYPLQRIADVPDGADLSGFGSIGLIFPVYAWGMPEMVERFIAGSRFSKDSYIWAAAINGGNPGPTLKNCGKTVRRSGGTLQAGFALKHFSPSGESNPTGIIRFMQKISSASPREYSPRLKTMVEAVGARKKCKIETVSPAGNFFGSLIHSSAVKLFSKLDREFVTTGSCTGCGFCAKVCPAGNIEWTGETLQWKGNCQQCYSCVACCPKGGIATKGEGFAKLKLNPQIDRKELIP